MPLLNTRNKIAALSNMLWDARDRIRAIAPSLDRVWSSSVLDIADDIDAVLAAADPPPAGYVRVPTSRRATGRIRVEPKHSAEVVDAMVEVGLLHTDPPLAGGDYGGCANCGCPSDLAPKRIGEGDGEWTCSTECSDMLDDDGCPFEKPDGLREQLRRAARIRAPAPAARVLSSGRYEWWEDVQEAWRVTSFTDECEHCNEIRRRVEAGLTATSMTIIGLKKARGDHVSR